MIVAFETRLSFRHLVLEAFNPSWTSWGGARSGCWEDTTGGDGDGAEELGELLIVADRQLDVAGDDAGLLVVAGGVAGELKDLGGEVLEDRGEVHGGTGTDAGGVLANLEVARDAADGELKARLGGSGTRPSCRTCPYHDQT